MRENSNLPWWLRQNIEIIGFEEDDDDSEEEEDEDEDSDEEEDSENEDSDEEDDDQDEDEEEDDSGPNVDGLKSALRKERMARKKAERELKKLKKKPKSSENDDGEEDSSNANDGQSERLAAALRDQAINNLIRKHASNFADVEDAVKFVNRDEIEVDQDEDDPSVIEVDEDSIKDAVKALAKKKKYLLKPSDPDKSKSGSKFNGKNRSKKEISKDELRKKYSALRR